MTTYVQSAYNRFETPSGAIGEAPDPAGDLLRLRDQIDARIGIGGAEYVGTQSVLQTIPTSRCYRGKLAYVADIGATYRYDGTYWRVWNWLAVPFDTYATLANSAFDNANGATELNVSSGVATLSFALYSSSGIGANVSFLTLKQPFRPAGITPIPGHTRSDAGAFAVAAYSAYTDGNVGLITNGGVAVNSVRGAGPFRITG
jgi:hypothetical protein